MRVLPIVLAAVALAGCQKKADTGGDQVLALRAPPKATAAKPAPPQTTAPQTAAAQPANLPMLAYSYDYGIRAPAKALRALAAGHEQACTLAGPALCQVVGATSLEAERDDLQGELEIKAAPAWLKAFRDRLESDAEAAGGQVVSAQVTSEDLARQVVDTEAAIRAKTTLRDRLQALLATHQGKMSDLLEVEQKLAEVQGELDATQSELAAMKERVATSDLKIHYRTRGGFGSRGAWAPLDDAFHGVAGALAETLAAMLFVVTFVLPWAIAGGAIFWAVRRLRRRSPPKPPRTS